MLGPVRWSIVERIGVDISTGTFEHGFGHFAGMFGDKYRARSEGADYNIGLNVGYNKRSAEKVNHYQSYAVC